MTNHATQYEPPIGRWMLSLLSAGASFAVLAIPTGNYGFLAFLAFLGFFGFLIERPANATAKV